MDRIERLRKTAMALPLQPGVYLMKDQKGNIIYVGKAKALKNRVSQYFGSDANHTEKVRRMVAQVENFDYIVAGSEFEALVLECSLIKQYAPKYNILLKDDKGYSYIRISPPPYSRITAALQRTQDGARYVGPYMSSYAVKQAVDEVNKLFGLSTCRKPLGYRKPCERPCLNYHIGQCCAPCSGKVGEADYAERVEQAIQYLTDGSAKLVASLQKRMQQASEDLDFETAARLRDRIRAVERMNDRQKVVQSRVPHQDIIAFAKAQDVACFEVFRFVGGALADREHFFVDAAESEAAVRGEFLRRYYSMRETIPPRILLDGETDDRDLLESWLSQKVADNGKRYTVKFVCPQKGEQAALLKMCAENAAERVAQKLQTGGREVAGLSQLQQLLGLADTPTRIESYDISHTAGEDAVAGMVVFQNGRPHRSAYRRFTIRCARGGDDPASLREVLARRFNEYEQHKDEPDGFGKLPDLILLDGGKAQVQAVKPLADAYSIPLFGLVKDNHHRTRAVTDDGGELSLSAHRAAFTLVSSIQEEVHRYAIGFHRQKRKKRTTDTALVGIEGVGKTRAAALLRHFGSLTAVKNATVEQLSQVKGMTRPAALSVYAYFHNENE